MLLRRDADPGSLWHHVCRQQLYGTCVSNRRMLYYRWLQKQSDELSESSKLDMPFGTTPTAVEFVQRHEQAEELVIADATGALNLHRLLPPPSGPGVHVGRLLVHQGCVFDIKAFDGGQRLVSCSEAIGPSMCLWDIERAFASSSLRYEPTGLLRRFSAGHMASIKCLDVNPLTHGSTCIVSGGRDGRICVWDVRGSGCSGSNICGGAPVQQVEGAHANPKALKGRKRRKMGQGWTLGLVPSVTGVSFLGDSNFLASACSARPGILLWDMRNLSQPIPRAFQMANHATPGFPGLSKEAQNCPVRGIASLRFDNTNGNLLALGVDPRAYVYNVNKPVCAHFY